MRRNNLVFLWGSIVEYAEREVKHEATTVPLIDLLVQTDKPEISGQHKVMVRGQQAQELPLFPTGSPAGPACSGGVGLAAQRQAGEHRHGRTGYRACQSRGASACRGDHQAPAIDVNTVHQLLVYLNRYLGPLNTNDLLEFELPKDS
jgi:hypothetical protein